MAVPWQPLGWAARRVGGRSGGQLLWRVPAPLGRPSGWQPRGWVGHLSGSCLNQKLAVAGAVAGCGHWSANMLSS
eukprot:2276879-Alexandrium_andersonii.AAC.1